DIKAFQVLWNANNPNDTIAADGAYGPATEARLQKSPAAGFAIGPSCAAGSELQLGSGSASPLYDPSWTSKTVVTSIASAVAVGAKTTIDLDVTTPDV